MKNYVHAKQLPLASRPSVFQSPDEDDEEDYEQWLEIKGKLRGLLPSFLPPPSSSGADPQSAGKVWPGIWGTWDWSQVRPLG